MAKYNRLVARGKNPDYKVAAPQIIDLELVRSNIIVLIDRLIAHYEETNAHDAAENKRAKAERLIDYLKENASGMINKVTKQSARNRAIKLMEEVGISEPRKRYNQYPFEFSGGLRQRIGIAIALAADPDVLICDEPTTALDVTIQAQILELINRLKKERNLSIIFITHDLGVVANMADRIAVMYAGKIVEYGTAEEVFYEPAHPYTWAL
ncbi:MAG: ABC transporter ATP-binding protein, partial [Kiritimatiellae bacterium]|nr:ABC transporter ATP-binding protein [Kiritimatiellia bacterium]